MLRPDFDPDATGQAEYEFWRAHNDRDVPRLRTALESWTGKLYGLNPEMSAEAVAFLLEATQHHDDRDWSQATLCAERYYRVIQGETDLSFSAKRAGSLEITWWRIHDDLERKPDKTPLVKAFQALYAEIFGLKPSQTLAAAGAHVQATVEHDRAEAEGVTPEDAERHWQAAAAALKRSYESLVEATG